MTAHERGVSLSLPFESASAAVVRRELAAWMARQLFPGECLDDARLVVSELVGNAVRHASPIDPGVMLVDWHREDDALALSVTDGGARTLPRQRRARTDETGGRGLAIVDALAERWWVDEEHNTVHARLSMALPPQRTASA